MCDTLAAARHPKTVQPAIPFSIRDLLPPAIRRLAPALDGLTGLAALQRLYRAHAGGSYFPADALRTLGIEVLASDEEIDSVPVTGPLIVIANHPHGLADGLALAHLTGRVRRDVKVLGNDLLARIPEMRPYLIAVDSFRLGQRRNRAAVRKAIEWLHGGHVLIVFPSAEVSHVQAPDGRVLDRAWHDGVSRLAHDTGAPVLPMFIEGSNSAAFLAAGRLHPTLRTALLPRELLRLRGRTLQVRIGRPIAAHRLEAFGTPAARTAYLRVRTYGLARIAKGRRGALRRFRRTSPQEPIAPAVDRERLDGDIAALPAESRLLESGPWTVYCVDGAAAPRLLEEIGRLREVTFRASGEGTGRARDLDRFDEHYRQLFVWHRGRQAVAGAYRVGPTDRVGGISRLYTRSLFRYPARLLEELGPALELGRSFVAPEFQRDYQPLLLLWRGIGALVAREPRYRMLFGPVSISAEYGHVTRQILARFLLANRYSARLGGLVRPKRPLARDGADGTDALVHSTVASRLEDVEAIVRELEADRRGMPVLLRQYLKLNAKLLGFSVDPAFGHVLDGLIVVDLLDVERTLLARYLGNEGAARFLAWHAVDDRRSTPAVTGLTVEGSYAG